MTTNQGTNKKKREKKVLECANKLFETGKYIIDFLKRGTFPYKGDVFKPKKEESKEKSEELKEELKEESEED